MSDLLAPWSRGFVERWSAVVAGALALEARDGWVRRPRPARRRWLRGPLLAHADAALGEAAEVAATAPGGAAQATIRILADPDQAIAPGQPVSMRMPLAGLDAEGVLRERLSSGCRNRLRKAQRSDLGFRWTTDSAGLSAAWAVLQAIHRRHGTPLFRRGLLEALAADGLLRIGLVTRDEEPVAMLTLATDGRIAWVPWCGALAEHHALSPNHFSHWAAIGAALDAGCAVFDFGRSPHLGGTYEFKRKWGAEPIPIIEIAGGSVSDAGDGYRLAQLFSAGWRRVPQPIATPVGAALFRALAL